MPPPTREQGQEAPEPQAENRLPQHFPKWRLRLTLAEHREWSRNSRCHCPNGTRRSRIHRSATSSTFASSPPDTSDTLPPGSPRPFQRRPTLEWLASGHPTQNSPAVRIASNSGFMGADFCPATLASSRDWALVGPLAMRLCSLRCRMPTKRVINSCRTDVIAPLERRIVTLPAARCRRHLDVTARLTANGHLKIAGRLATNRARPSIHTKSTPAVPSKCYPAERTSVRKQPEFGQALRQPRTTARRKPRSRSCSLSAAQSGGRPRFLAWQSDGTGVVWTCRAEAKCSSRSCITSRQVPGSACAFVSP